MWELFYDVLQRLDNMIFTRKGYVIFLLSFETEDTEVAAYTFATTHYFGKWSRHNWCTSDIQYSLSFFVSLLHFSKSDRLLLTSKWKLGQKTAEGKANERSESSCSCPFRKASRAASWVKLDEILRQTEIEHTLRQYCFRKVYAVY